YVARLRAWQGPPSFPSLTVLPEPALCLMVNLGDAFPVYEAGPRATSGASCVLGLWDTALLMEWPHDAHDAHVVGVTFRPGGAAPFLGLPLDELRNQLAPLEALWGRAAAEELRERLSEAPTATAQLALLERLLLARLARLGQVSHRRDPTRDPGLAL